MTKCPFHLLFFSIFYRWRIAPRRINRKTVSSLRTPYRKISEGNIVQTFLAGSNQLLILAFLHTAVVNLKRKRRAVRFSVFLVIFRSLKASERNTEKQDMLLLYYLYRHLFCNKDSANRRAEAKLALIMPQVQPILVLFFEAKIKIDSGYPGNGHLNCWKFPGSPSEKVEKAGGKERNVFLICYFSRPKRTSRSKGKGGCSLKKEKNKNNSPGGLKGNFWVLARSG